MTDEEKNHTGEDPRGLRPGTRPERRRDTGSPRHGSPKSTASSPRTWAARKKSGKPAGRLTPMTGKAMTAEEYHRRFADQIIEQIKRGAAPWQKPWKAGRARSALEPRHGPALLRRQQPASGSGGPRPRLLRHPLGDLPADSGPQRPDPQGRARHANPLLSGPPAHCRQGSTGPSRHRRAGPPRLPVRTPACALDQTLHRL